MSGSREHEHVITMRRPSPGIHWLVTHLESMTQLLVMRMRGEPSGRVPPSGLGLSHRGGGRAVGEGPYFLGDGAPVGGGGQLAEHREQPEVDALARRRADQPLRSAALPTPLN